jgi:hypothetical protein
LRIGVRAVTVVRRTQLPNSNPICIEIGSRPFYRALCLTYDRSQKQLILHSSGFQKILLEINLDIEGKVEIQGCPEIESVDVWVGHAFSGR